jgi:hypothetical protein
VKPTLFISHATADAEVAKKLRDWLLFVTANSVEVFASTDRQSLRLGDLWPSSVAAALQRSEIVLVLVSPASDNSAWVSFEAGYALGAGKLLMPLVFPAFNQDRLRLPLQIHQHEVLDGAEGLKIVLERINTALGTTFTAMPHQLLGEIVDGAATSYTDHWPMNALALPSREAMYAEIVRLIHGASPEVHIRATTAIRQHGGTDDPAYLGYVEAAAAKCGQSARRGSAADYTLYVYFPEERLPPDREEAIRVRQRAFREHGAEDRFFVYRLRDTWLLNVLTIGDDHAIISFPGRDTDPKVRHAVRVSSPELVAKINHWFTECVRPLSDRVDLETLRVVPHS